MHRNPEAAVAVLGDGPWSRCTLPQIAAAIAQAPTTRATNRTLAMLAKAICDAPAGALTWAAHHALDPNVSRRARPWGEVEARWQSGALEARFSIHAEQARTPHATRRRLMNGWQRRFRRERSGIADAPVLVLCSHRRDVEAWGVLYNEMGRQHGFAALPRMLLGLTDDVTRPHTLHDRLWFEPKRLRYITVVEGMKWGPEPDPDEPVPPMAVVAPHIDPPVIGHPADALRALADPPGRLTRSQRVARAALALSEEGHRTAAWLASQPWLAADELAAIERTTLPGAERRLAQLLAAGVARPGSDGRWSLTRTGMQLAAARLGMLATPAAFSHATSCIWSDAPPEPAPPHEAGVSRMVGLLARAGGEAGVPLSRWIDERYWRHEISRDRPLPDGVFTLQGGDTTIRGLAEYEHSLTSPQRSAGKAERWTEWYANEDWRIFFDEPPLLLFTHALYAPSVGSLYKAITSMPPSIPAGVAPLDSLAEHGLDAPIWRPSGGGHGVTIFSLLDVAQRR